MVSMRIDEHCPACGYDLGFLAWNDDSPSDEICPSCGIQFGYDDSAGGNEEARARLYEQWRKKWIESGMRWSSVARSPPTNWKPTEQLLVLDKQISGH
jgi:hypothetical protein